MEIVQRADAKLSGVFKGMPPLSNDAREGLAKAWPWIALVFGILQLLAAYSLWRLTQYVSILNDLAQSLGTYSGYNVGISSFDKIMIYLGVIVLALDAVILLLAFPKLRARQRAGWDLLFLGVLLNVVYAVVVLFVNGRGVGSFIMNLIGSALGFYLLYQVKDKFVGRSTSVPKA